MDYVVGSVAALISGNVTPNRPKLVRRALTPTKHQPSPNVTPKSELVEDRSIFLSPTLQKKKAIVKKSPKRIFQNPDLDITENEEASSPNAEKVKKHLKDDLEGEEMGKSNKKSPKRKHESVHSSGAVEMSKIEDIVTTTNTSPKKKKKRVSESNTQEKRDDIEKSLSKDVTLADAVKGSPKMTKQRRKSVAEKDHSDKTINSPTINKSITETSPKKKKISNIEDTPQISNETKSPNKSLQNSDNEIDQVKPVNIPKNDKKKNKKKLKSNIENKENNECMKAESQEKGKKKRNRKNKNKKQQTNSPKPETAVDKEVSETIDTSKSINVSEDTEKSILKNKSKKKKSLKPEKTENDDEKIDNNDSGDKSDEEELISNTANPNAVTEQDSDSEHDSDDEIHSENEEENEKVLQNDEQNSSDGEDEENKKEPKKVKKGKQESTEVIEKEVDIEDEIRRTLFVGNVPLSKKTRKEIKKIFRQYGEIQTVRIRFVPVKDARVTPKMAVIKNELHPERSTVNVYVKFADEASVEKALAENNTVLNGAHLRVTRTKTTGAEHDPKLAIFVGNMPFGMEDEQLRAMFEKCGDVESVRIIRDKKTNAGKGFGYVNFTSKDGVELALNLSEEDLTVKNRILRVKRSTQVLGQKGPGPKRQGLNRPEQNRPGQSKPWQNRQGQNRYDQNNQGQSRPWQDRQGQNNQGQARPWQNRQGENNQRQARPWQNRSEQNGPGQNRPWQNRSNQNDQGQAKPWQNRQGQNRPGPSQDAGQDGAHRRIMNKRKHQENNDGPPNKVQNINQPIREKKQRKEFVGMTSEKKKKHKFDKTQKKKKALSEILSKKKS